MMGSMFTKHASPTHPGTGSDQSVHGGSGGGADAELRQVFDDDQEDSRFLFHGGNPMHTALSGGWFTNSPLRAASFGAAHSREGRGWVHVITREQARDAGLLEHSDGSGNWSFGRDTKPIVGVAKVEVQYDRDTYEWEVVEVHPRDEQRRGENSQYWSADGFEEIADASDIVPVEGRTYHSSQTEITGDRLKSWKELSGGGELVAELMAQGYTEEQAESEAWREAVVFTTTTPQSEYGNYIYEVESTSDESPPYGWGEDADLLFPDKNKITRRFEVVRVAKHASHDQTSHGNWSRGTSAAQHTSSLAEHGGFTVHYPTGVTPTEGWAVALPDAEAVYKYDDFTVRDIGAYRRAHAEALARPTTHFGAWHDTETDMIYLDITEVVMDESEAERLGKEYGQVAIFNLATFEERRL